VEPGPAPGAGRLTPPGVPIESNPAGLAVFDGGAGIDQSPPNQTLDRIAMAQRGVFGPNPNPDDEPGWPVEYE
jgi:hypothetical protein